MGNFSEKQIELELTKTLNNILMKKKEGIYRVNLNKNDKIIFKKNKNNYEITYNRDEMTQDLFQKKQNKWNFSTKNYLLASEPINYGIEELVQVAIRTIKTKRYSS